MARVSLWLVCFVLVSVMGLWCLKLPWFAIHDVRIVGDALQNKEVIQSRLNQLQGQDLLHLKDRHVSDLLRDADWIDHWRLRKHFCHHLDVVIEAKRPVAVWQGQWVNEAGSIFKQGDYPGDRMTLLGEQSDLPFVVKHCLAWAHQLGSESVKSCGFNHGQWSMVLASGLVVILGSEFLPARFERLQRIFKASEAWRQWKSLDMRYPHGFAYVLF